MLKTYRIISLLLILFLFGFTLITASPVIAQTVDQLIESIEKLDANDRARVLEYKYSPPKRLSDVTPAAAADGPWDKSMGMRHPDRPCMDRTKVRGGCGPDTRSPEQIASDPYDTNNPVSLAARAESGAHSPSPAPHVVVSNAPSLKCNKPTVDKHGLPIGTCNGHTCTRVSTQEDCNTCSTMITKWSSYIKEHGRETCIESQRVNVGDTPWGDKMATECLKQGPRDHNVPSVQVMQASHDVCMLDAAEGCDGDRTTIKSIKDNQNSLLPQGSAGVMGFGAGSIGAMCMEREFQLHCWKGGCTNGEGLIMKYDPCANANASDVIANRNGCHTHKLSDGTRRSVGHKDCAVSKC